MKKWLSIRRLAFVALLVFATFTAVSAFFAYRFTSPPRRTFGDTPERFLAVYENIRFPARDGISLSGWFVPRPEAKQAVVLLHGYGSTRTQMLARARFFHDQGYAVLLYDARAHGQSGGELASFGWFETRDLLGAIDWLRARGFSSFGCVGASQGGATIALAAAELRDVRWVILESVYPTLANAVDRRFRRTVFLPGWFAGALMVPFAAARIGVDTSMVSPRDTVTKLGCPVLVMNGDRDEHTHLEDAREIFDHAAAPKSWWIVPGAAHNDLYGFARVDYEHRVLDFIATVR